MKHENKSALPTTASAPREITPNLPQPSDSNPAQPLADWFDDLLGELQEDENYWFDAAKDGVATQVCQVMERHGVKKADLARRLDKSPTYVTKVLKGTTNFTLDSLVSMARALDCRLEVRFVEAQTDEQTEELESAEETVATSWNGVERRVVDRAHLPRDWEQGTRWKNVLPFPQSRNFHEVETRILLPREFGEASAPPTNDIQERTENDRIPIAA